MNVEVIFGLGRLHRLGAFDAQLVFLKAIFNCGINRFDVAPLYGGGSSEYILGRAIGGYGYRSKIHVNTKIGLLPLLDYSNPKSYLARFRVNQLATSFASVVFGFRRKITCRDSLEIALENSLNRLKVDKLSTIFIHEPEVFSASALDTVINFLQEAKYAGAAEKIGFASYDQSICEQALEDRSVDVIQLPADFVKSLQKKNLKSCNVFGIFNSQAFKDSRCPICDLQAMDNDLGLIYYSSSIARVTDMVRGEHGCR